MTIKVGDKVRILVDRADFADVKRGDIFTVDHVFHDGGVQVGGVNTWMFNPDTIEKVIEDQITLNGETWLLTPHVDIPTITIDGIVYDMAEA